MDEATTGEILVTDTTTSFAWKVHDFFRLPTQEYHCAESPLFSFLDAKWQIAVYPNRKLNSDRWIGIYLRKVSYDNKEHLVAFHLGIRNGDGTEYKSITYEVNFEGKDRCGTMKFAERTSLDSKMYEIAPEGTVTFFCTLESKAKASKFMRKEAATQTRQDEDFQKLLQSLQELLNGEDGDILLRVKDKEFRAHKAVLKVRSPVFKSMFSHGMKEESSGVVDISDCDPAAFEVFLHYLYCATVQKFSTSTVFDLYFIADKYGVEELKSLCTEFIIDILSTDTFVDSLTLALRHNESEILKHVISFFVENAAEIVETCQWLIFLKEYPVEANELFTNLLKKKISK